MKRYEAPICECLAFAASDILMNSENALRLDTLDLPGLDIL